MNIIYSSFLCSRRLLQFFFEKGNKKPIYSVQKFHRLLATGLVENGANLETLTIMPYPKGVYGKRITEPDETEDGIKYHYVRTWDYPVIKRLGQFFSSFFYMVKWCSRHKERIAIFDVLNVSVCIGGLLACRLTRTKSLGIVTDIPGMKDEANDQSIAHKINMMIISGFDYYCLLTEQMNEVANRHHRPYIVMEGLVDHLMDPGLRKPDPTRRILLYAGGLYERYGVKALLEAYLQISKDFPDTVFHCYGFGPMTEWITEQAEKNQQLVFYGPRPNEEVVADELMATLLINPRPTHEKFTKYSFPSKNIEYMCSGTAVLTTRLPGMPNEYWDKVYLFEEETTEGYRQVLQNLLLKPREDLITMGEVGQRFVLQKKNNIVQSKRILDLLSEKGKV